MIRETVNALAACVVTLILCAGIYPAAVWGMARVAFPHQAEGSLIEAKDGTVIGSELVAQPFASDRYFHPRPSACDYNAAATSGSNLGTKNPALHDKIKERAEALKATPENPAPPELVTASGGGLDPDITPVAALYQAARVAEARKMPIEQVRSLIERMTGRSGLVIGCPARVNVLRLNLALDEEKPVQAVSAAETSSGVRETTSGTVDDLKALRSQMGGLAEQLRELEGRLRARTEALRQDGTNRAATAAALKTLEDRVASLSDEVREVPRMVDRLGSLDERVKATTDVIQSLRVEVGETRGAIKALAVKPGR